MLLCSLMENCELSNPGLIPDDKIKENELAQGLRVREQPFLPEPHTEGRMIGDKEDREKGEVRFRKNFYPLLCFCLKE